MGKQIFNLAYKNKKKYSHFFILYLIPITLSSTLPPSF